MNITDMVEEILNLTISGLDLLHNTSNSNESSNGTAEDDFDYELDDYIPLEDVLPVTLTYSLVFMVGLIGNILVIFSILYYRRMRTTTNVFLLNLASADLLLIILCVPIKFIRCFWITFSSDPSPSLLIVYQMFLDNFLERSFPITSYSLSDIPEVLSRTILHQKHYSCLKGGRSALICNTLKQENKPEYEHSVIIFFFMKNEAAAITRHEDLTCAIVTQHVSRSVQRAGGDPQD
ncbi:hypothetical protein RRG08_010837 [Elysia crispata]|uniref:G-protein coupled receptors family 1 profile domain-containing protein n=1 Tax=Elysia crispata TaxID=231223 RepID=A0AAE0ZMT6_9GAST|nr:hypothetical protein RRG08_010837 [Elysia crispata]